MLISKMLFAESLNERILAQSPVLYSCTETLKLESSETPSISKSNVAQSVSPPLNEQPGEAEVDGLNPFVVLGH